MKMLLSLLAGLTLAAAGGAADRPNFVVIMGEAQGWTSSSVQMDDRVPESKSTIARTPNLEKLAAGGMRFASFYAASPRCTPTRAALFTGRSPAALHMTFVQEAHGGAESGFSAMGSKLLPAEATTELPTGVTTIAGLLQRSGYATAHFGKWHVGRVSPAQHGFDVSDGPTNNGGSASVEAFGMTERGIDFMSRQVKAGKPFYLQLSHYPGRGGTEARPETYATVRQRVRNPREQRLAGAAAVTEDMDASIGLLLAALDRLAIAGRTYVIYTSDHGALGRNGNEPLASGKGTVWEGGLRVPLIVRGPGIKPGACSHVRATTVDLFPTMAALAQSTEPLPRDLEGGSLAPIVAGAAGATVKSAREEIVVHVPHYDRNDQAPASAILLGSYKLIHLYESGALMLFNVDTDLSERRDLATTEPQKAAELDRRLTGYLQAVGAQMPAANPQYDASRERAAERRRE